MMVLLDRNAMVEGVRVAGRRAVLVVCFDLQDG